MVDSSWLYAGTGIKIATTVEKKKNAGYVVLGFFSSMFVIFLHDKITKKSFYC